MGVHGGFTNKGGSQIDLSHEEDKARYVKLITEVARRGSIRPTQSHQMKGTEAGSHHYHCPTGSGLGLAGCGQKKLVKLSDQMFLGVPEGLTSCWHPLV